MAAAKGTLDGNCDAKLAICVFSKDRAFQLLCCLGSLLQHVKGASLHIFVLFYSSSSSSRQGYEFVEALFRKSHARIHWEEEKHDRPLGQLLDDVIVKAESSESQGLLFTVDDALWFENFDAGAAVRLLEASPSVYAFHVKLNPRVEYAHPNDKFMKVPKFQSFASDEFAKCSSQNDSDGRLGTEPELLVYKRSQGEYDWNYPWELSASIYRLADVREMLDRIREHFGESGVNHPNRLEGYGVRLFKQEKVKASTNTSHCACLAYPAVCVVTINRVQELFDNPVYSIRCTGSESTCEASLAELDIIFRRALLLAAKAPQVGWSARLANALRVSESSIAERFAADVAESDGRGVSGLSAVLGFSEEFCGQLLDSPPCSLIPIDRYRSAYIESVHAPLLEALSASLPMRMPESSPLVSWLVPVRDTPQKWLQEAWNSIQAQEGMGPGSWELIIVDDGSKSTDTLSILATLTSMAQVKVLRSGGQGIAHALNEGWKHCQGEYIARLDGDDIAHCQRLRTQVSYLQKHPSISILGGGFRTFSSSDELRNSRSIAAAPRYRMTCHPVLTRWQMLFSCSLAHPTVIFRKADFSSGPYPLGEEAEDHCCWLSLPFNVQLANQSDIVCYLRRHPGSRSSAASASLRRSSHGGVHRAFEQHFGTRDLQIDDIAILWGSGNVSSAEQARRLSAALDDAGRFFANFVKGHCLRGGTMMTTGSDFHQDFVGARADALIEYIRAACNKLRGLFAVQSLADGDVSSGAEMMKLWLDSGAGGSDPSAALKSLGALVGAGFPA